MTRFKQIGLVGVIIFISIQLIRPARNKSDGVPAADISKLVIVPDSVQVILANACYDCHSNNTRYPWYINIQPMGWFMAKHIRKGKAALNFSEFGSYSPRKQASKLTEIANSVRDGIMPLASYRWFHKKARLSGDEKRRLINWVHQTKDSLSKK